MQQAELSQYELLVAYLKIFMIKSMRIKSNQNPELARATAGSKEPFVLQQLVDHIEGNFRKEHQPGHYGIAAEHHTKGIGQNNKAALQQNAYRFDFRTGDY